MQLQASQNSWKMHCWIFCQCLISSYLILVLLASSSTSSGMNTEVKLHAVI
jgi:hypothetical protein